MRRRLRSFSTQNSVSPSEGDQTEQLSSRDIQDLDDLGNDLINELENNFEPNRENSELSLVQPLPEASQRSESRRRFEAALQSFQILGSVSAPPSPVERNRSVFWDISDSALNSRRVASVESLPLSVESLALFRVLPELNMVNLATDLATVRPTQGAHKRWVTRLLNDIEKEKTENILTLVKFKNFKGQIEDQIQKIIDCEGKLAEVYTRHKVADDNADREEAEQVIFDFVQDAHNSLAGFEAELAPAPLGPVVALDEPITGQQLLDAMKKMGNNSISVKYDCSNFYGNETDRLAFKNWLSEFEGVLKTQTNWDDERKLGYLKKVVLGNAATYIAHLEPGPGNYDAAVKALKDQYLNEAFITDEYFYQLLSETPAYDENYCKTSQYLASVRNKCYNLKTHYHTDLLDPATGGYKLLSHIVFSKLSREIRRELKAKTANDYPTFAQIMEKHASVIQNIISTRAPKPSRAAAAKFSKGSVGKAETPALNFGTQVQQPGYAQGSNSYISNNSAGNSDVYHCRFCNVDGHTNLRCHNYVTVDERVARCKVLGICHHCTCLTHSSDKCPGLRNALWKACRFCKSHKHVQALCPDPQRLAFNKPTNSYLCLSTDSLHQTNYLLPVIALDMQKGSGPKVRVNALFDTCSSRSYLDSETAARLGLQREDLQEVDYEVKTFLGGGRKTLGESTLVVHLPSGRQIGMPVFIDRTFEVVHEVRGLSQAIKNMRDANIPLVAKFEEGSNIVPLNGLIGQDILDFIQYRKVPCLKGSAIEIETGYLPSGNTEHFLRPGQVSQAGICCRTEVNFKTIVSNISVPEQFVNACLEPKETYMDDLGSFFEDSNVERRIDNMINCDPVGVATVTDDVSNYDSGMISKFKSGIDVKDYVYVDLVWHDNVDEVPSNWALALKVLERVSDSLIRKGQQDAYNKVILEMLDEGIIDDITYECGPHNYSEKVWIPHRPVIKDDDQSTFKMRPVYNCSFKSRKDKPSLNEAAYQGINIMQNMLDLILQFKANKYVLLGDLRKAFLQVRLKSLKDKNRFCFFLRVNDQIRCYRFNTIIFGFCSSPFILNYVIKHIAESFPSDSCTEMIRSNFFVDNLVKTSNDAEKLTWLYNQCAERMDGAHFELRSCNTNNENLKQVMEKDERYITHGCDKDKVLGYRYSSDLDTMSLAPVKLDESADTKRKILSESARIFDPLLQAAPVIVKPKVLVSKLWAKKKSENHWDEIVEDVDQKQWSLISKDLSRLSEIEFPRQSLSEDEVTDLFLFADASKQAYGFVAYMVQGGISNFIFAKAKVAPLKERTLPQLELLGALLALQGLENLLITFSNVKFKNVFLALDAQVVLAWLTSSNNVKSVYASNRIKDAKLIMNNIAQKYNITVQCKYVPTAENPGDLLTRGLTFDKFKECFDFWIHGPSWIRSPSVVWPSSELRCLNEDSRNLILATQVEVQEPRSPLVPFEKFSWLHKLIGATSKALRFARNLGALKGATMRSAWGTEDFNQCALLHLLQVMQSQKFPEELAYLQGPEGRRIPDRVVSMNLFLDPQGIIRCDGRLGRASYYDYEAINPILLPRDHPLTVLIIRDCHIKVKHLGVQTTLNKLRMSGFRVINPYRTVKAVLHPCILCRRMNALAYRYPKMTDMPKDRVRFVRPYQHVGIDYTGHIWCRDKGQTVKLYILLFTCLNVRSVHIELIPEMSTNQFVLAFIRFCNEYGIPATVYSDNAQSFISGVHVLEQVFTSNEFKAHFATFNIKHIRIPVYSPWVGSTWERMIKTVKACLFKCIGKRRLDYFRLKTILSDIQQAVNCRPLTYRCTDNMGLEILTPNHFLKPYAETSLLIKNPKDLFPSSVSRRQLVHSLEIRNNMLQNFKEIWYEEYLLGLQDTYKNLHDAKFKNRIRVGDIVLIRNPRLKRDQWILGRVLQLYPGNDGKVRSAKVLRSGDWEKGPLLRSLYSVNHLHPLELNITHEYEVPVPDVDKFTQQVVAEVEPDQDFSEAAGAAVGAGGPADRQESVDPTDMVCDTTEATAGPSNYRDELGPQAKYSALDHLLGGGGALSSPSAGDSLTHRVGVDDQLQDEVDPLEVDLNQDCNLVPLRDEPAVPKRKRPAHKRRVRSPQRPLQDQYEFS